MKTLDCRNLACPAPVIETKKALERGQQPLLVLVDDGAPRENVARFAKSRGLAVAEAPEGNGWALTIGNVSGESAFHPAAAPAGDVAILVTSDRLGDGPEELGRLLMKNFLTTLLECDPLPRGIYFMNTGVHLTCEGSDTLEALQRLEELGAEVRSCGLCLDYFGLKERLRAGATTNMLTTAEALLGTSKVIRL